MIILVSFPHEEAGQKVVNPEPVIRLQRLFYHHNHYEKNENFPLVIWRAVFQSNFSPNIESEQAPSQHKAAEFSSLSISMIGISLQMDFGMKSAWLH